MAGTTPDETTERKGREGGRWINERPTPEEVAQWFQASMPIDEKLNATDYLGGVVLIPAVDSKVPVVTGFNNQGTPIIERREELAFIPYAKVETRVAYFWDLIEAHEEWVAVVEQVESPRLSVDPVEEVIEAIDEGEEAMRTITRSKKPVSALAQMVHQLPQGFSIMSVAVGEGYSHFICCTIRVAIYDRSEYAEHREKAVPLRAGRGTKQVPLLGSYQQRVWADNNALMKAETGALGRALGFAGIFVIPGSGVATAEDMLESLAQGTTPAEPEPAAEAAAPTEAPVRTGAEAAQDEEAELHSKALELYQTLKDDHPDDVEKFTQWAHSRRLRSLSEAKGAMLRGVVRKLEKLIDEAKQRQEGGDEPSAEAEGDDTEGGPAADGESG